MRKAAEWSTVVDTFNFKMHYSDAAMHNARKQCLMAREP